MEILLEIAGWIVYGFYGALVGVLWPPKSPAWARWQLCGLALGLLAALCFATAILSGWFAVLSAIAWPAAVIGMLSFVGYAVVGNICRVYHERK